MLVVLADFDVLITTWFGSDKEPLTWIQMMVRAVITFLIAMALIRFAGIRSFGSKSAFDIVLSITMGAVLSRTITGQYSYWACIAGATVLALMHRLIAILTSSSKTMSNFFKGKPDVLFKDGRLIVENMKKHNLTDDDVTQALHKFGVSSLEEIEEAYFETDGKITIVPKQRIEGRKSV